MNKGRSIERFPYQKSGEVLARVSHTCTLDSSQIALVDKIGLTKNAPVRRRGGIRRAGMQIGRMGEQESHTNVRQPRRKHGNRIAIACAANA